MGGSKVSLPGGKWERGLTPWTPGGEGGKGHVVLGFRVPTTFKSKKFDDNR